MAATPSLCALIPAFNEAATIRDICQRTLAQTRQLIVVDDGSSDDTLGQIADLPVHRIRHGENQGKAASLWDGLEQAGKLGVEYAISLDGDAQHAPEDIPLLLEACRNHPRHIIIGARRKNRQAAPAARRFANAFADFWISWAAGQRIVDSQSGFRAYPLELLAHIDLAHDKKRAFVFESEILIAAAQAGFACHSVSIETRYPEQARKSHFRPLADITAIVIMVAGKLLRQGMNPVGLYRLLRTKT